MKINTEVLKKIFSEHLNSFIAGATTIIIGLLGFYLTPLKDSLFHFLYQENAEIKIMAQENIYKGDDLKLINILIKPSSKISIAEGTCEIIFDDSFLLLKNGKRVFKFSSIESADLLLDSTGINFKTLKSGKTSIKTIITTKHNTYSDSIQVNIKPPFKNDKPSISDFSGSWPFKLGFMNGEMNLVENDGNLSGNYYLENGESGVISGIRDGKTFKVDMIRKGEIFKWHINAIWKPNDSYIFIDGECLELIIIDNFWKRNNKDGHKFYSSVKK